MLKHFILCPSLIKYINLKKCVSHFETFATTLADVYVRRDILKNTGREWSSTFKF